MQTSFKEHMKDDMVNNYEAHSRERVLVSKLHRLLLKLSPDRRRKTLKELLSERQRLKLEHWILVQRQTPRSFAERPSVQCNTGASQRSSKVVNGFIERNMLKRKRQLDRRDLTTLNHAPGMVRNPQSNGCYYMAKVSVCNINLLSRADRNIRLVEKFHAALLAVRHRANSRSTSTFKATFCRSIFDALEKYCLDPADMGLRFFISFRPLWEPRPLCTGVYQMTELDAGLQAWQRLTDAHNTVRRQLHGQNLKAVPPEELVRTWQCFHEAYLNVMADAGYKMAAIKERLHALEARQFVQQELRVQAWNQSQMMREERQQSVAARRQERLATQEGRLRLRKFSEDLKAERNITKLLQTWGNLRWREQSFSRRKKLG